MKGLLLIGGVAALAATTFTPIAYADGDPSNLNEIVGQAYTQFQHRCTPGMEPQYQRVAWDSPPTGKGGTGHIIDLTKGLGGEIKVTWAPDPSPTRDAQKIVPAQPVGYWDIAFLFC